jgi:hypothetical protein
VGGEAPVTPVSSLDSSSLNLSYKPCDNRVHVISGQCKVLPVGAFVEGELHLVIHAIVS